MIIGTRPTSCRVLADEPSPVGGSAMNGRSVPGATSIELANADAASSRRALAKGTARLPHWDCLASGDGPAPVPWMMRHVSIVSADQSQTYRDGRNLSRRLGLLHPSASTCSTGKPCRPSLPLVRNYTCRSAQARREKVSNFGHGRMTFIGPPRQY